MLESISLRMYEPSSQRLFRYAQEARGYVHAANSKQLFFTRRNKIQINFRWFRQLCDHFRVHGEAYFLYKPKGKSRTFGLSGDEALRQLKKGLHNPQMAFIYHCYNHYFCPIGYDDSPINAVDAYR